MAAAVELKGLRKSFGRLETLHGIDLPIAAGEFVVLVGPSGCGKSTLLRLLAGLEEITAGDLLIDGRRVNDLPPAQRGIAMVFQSYALYPHMTVEQNMGFGLEMQKLSRADIASRVREAAARLELTPLLDRLPKQLSGGQRQRVAIGRAIVRDPRVFLFDEPLSNLDAALRVQMRLEIAKLQRSLGVTTVYVTHDQVEAMTLADKIVVLNAGRVEQVGAPLELYHRPQNLFVAGFIGSPKMNILPATVTRAGADGADLTLGHPPAGFALSLPPEFLPLAPGQALSVGIRPEHLEVVSPDQGDLTADIDAIEQLGEAHYLYTRLPDGTPLTVKRDGDSICRSGERLGLALPRSQLHLFDNRGIRLG
jgi:ABC-type sugar transport system ATPase subunit